LYAARPEHAAGSTPTMHHPAHRWTRLLLAGICLLLAACQSPVRLMPTPVSFKNAEVDPFEAAGYKAQGTEIPVFYATNRGAIIEIPKPLHTALPSEQLRMGVAHVQIGDENLDWETLHRLSTTSEPGERPIVDLDRLEQRAKLGPKESVAGSAEAQAFFAQINQALAASPNSELVIYVHGSNNTVPRAAAQAAQFRHFTGRRVVVLSFMWPSAGSILRYLTDINNAAASVEPFAKLVEMLAENTQASKIDIVAYSAGAQVTSPALTLLGQPRPGETQEQQRQRLRLGQIYYAAPDLDTRRFVDELGKYIHLTDRVTIAANLNDSALRAAAIINRASRAGRPNPTELSPEQTAFLADASQKLRFDLVKVDPNDIPGLPVTSHAFWYEDPWVSSDLLGLVLLDVEPRRRGLDEQQGPGGQFRYWTFPPDFYERIARLFGPPAAPAR
jgi:esterase/lipase superfamily enzyme